MTSFPDFTLFFVQKHSRLYNKKKKTRRLKDMNFIFLVVKKKQYFTHSLLFSPLENNIKIHIFASPCNIHYLYAPGSRLNTLPEPSLLPFVEQKRRRIQKKEVGVTRDNPRHAQ